MGTYIVRRLLLVIPTILAVYTITFVVMRATPGGPWDNADRPLSPQAIANLNAKYHLNQPLWKQYIDYLDNALHGDFGPSYVNTSRTVTDIIRDFLPVSIKLGIVAMIFGTALGLTLGVIAALNQNSWLDYTAMFGAVIGIATPNYVMATVLIYLLALELHLVPTTGWGGVLNVHIIIPALALSLGPAAQLARYTRASVLETLRQQYILTAQAKGLRFRAVVTRHVMKNALNPVVTIAALLVANVITGSFFVETICGVPGIGRYFVTAATGRDYPVLMALTLLFAVIIIFANLLVDIAYGFLDPRVTYS